MRKTLLVLVLAAFPALAQNTDIESLSGLQFNFGNPGARSLGMGGAFLGLADDASAAEANPAGLTILRKPEVTIEARNFLEQQVLTTSGTFPDLTRTAFSHYSNRVEVSFASFVYPVKNFTFGVYYHEPLKNQGAGSVLPQRNQFTGAVEKDIPNFFLPVGGTGPVTSAECDKIRQTKNNPAACFEFVVDPFITALDVQQRTYGIAGAYKAGNFSFGATARYQLFRESAFTFRLNPQTFEAQSIAVQATAKPDGANLAVKDDKDLTFAAGAKWAPNEKFSAGVVYKKGATFTAPTFISNAATGFDFVELAETKFHMPDSYGAGVSFRPIPVLTINADAVHVKYSNLIDDLVSTIAAVREIAHPYKINDVTELHLGMEYFFSTKIPLALRGGLWRDPAHSMQYNAPFTQSDVFKQAEAVGAAILYPKGSSQMHRSIGAGIAWPKFQIDAAYDTSKHYKVGSVSVITRF
jgi:long-subunit fatty acid transport protein